MSFERRSWPSRDEVRARRAAQPKSIFEEEPENQVESVHSPAPTYDYSRKRFRDRLSGMSEGAFMTSFVGCAVLGILVIQGGCAKLTEENYDSDDARKFLEQSGYTDIEHVDTDVFMITFRGCGRDDAIKYEFEATGPTGIPAEVDVCKGMLKGATIRQGG